jgi:hypothetical protein
VMRAVGKANKMNLRLHFLEPDGTVRYGDREIKQEGNEDTTRQFNSAVATTIEEDLSDFVIN